MILHGRNLMVLVGGEAIAAAKTCKMKISDNTIPVASPTSGQWEDAIPGRKSWQASCGHLVTSIVDAAAMVGTVVTLRVQIKGEIGLPFYSFISGITIETGSASDVNAIFWDTTSKQFVAMKLDGNTPKYYEEWSAGNGFNASTTYGVGTNFYDSGKLVYKKVEGTNDELVQEALQGSAIVKEWDVTGTIGNLANGSFAFVGKGALAVPTT